MHWEQLKNGELLRAAASNGFQAVLSIDKKIEHEQNLRRLPVAASILHSVSNSLASLKPFARRSWHCAEVS